MNRRQSAVLYTRSYTKKNGKKSKWYWYYTYDEHGKRRFFSLHTQSKTQAKHRLDELIASGEVLPPTGDTLRLQEFAEPYFQEGRCPYVRMKRLRGERITKKTISQNRSYLDNHILPALGWCVLSGLTPTRIDTFLLTLKEQKSLANKTINNILSCIRIVTAEAVRAGHLRTDPAKKVAPLPGDDKERGVLLPDEVKSLFAQESHWRNRVVYGINLTAATTGARLGELRGLKTGDFQGDRIVVRGVMREREGYVEDDTKTGIDGLRVIPVPRITQRALKRLAEGRESESFLFSLSGGKFPIGANVATRALHDALDVIGIKAEEREKRNIGFHSWRHFFNSTMRGVVSDAVLRQVVGHASVGMTERYSHRMPKHIEGFAAAQGDAFAHLAGGSDD